MLNRQVIGLAPDTAALSGCADAHDAVSKVATMAKNHALSTSNGAQAALSRAGDFVTIESAMVGQADVQAGNGVIHIIDSVLLPPQKK